MKHIGHLTGLILLPLLFACGSNNQSSTPAEQAAMPPIAANGQPAAESPALAADEAFATALQGKWERITYPFGTVEVKGKQIKIEEGEGMIEPAKFEDFRVSDNCPYPDGAKLSDNYKNFLVLSESKYCISVKLSGDTLSTRYQSTGSGIEYTRAK